MTNFYSVDYGPTPLVSGDSAIDFSEHFFAPLRATDPQYSQIDLRYLPKASLGGDAIIPEIAGIGFSGEVYDQYKNWYLPVNEQSFEQYYAQRSSRLRNTIKRKEKKLLRDHEVSIQIHRDRGPELDGAIAAYVSIYGKSWKNAEPFPDFIPGLCNSCAELGTLRLGLLTVDGAPAAAQLWIVSKSSAMIYKLAYDEEFSAFSPGSILSRDMFRDAMDVDKISEIDYGVGDEAYKREWMSDVRDIVGLRADNLRTANGAVSSIGATTKRLVKNLVKGNSH